MEKQTAANAIIDATCHYFNITTDDFQKGKTYNCSDARKVAVAVMLDMPECDSIAQAARLLHMRRNTASIALKALKRYLPYNRKLRDRYEKVKNHKTRQKYEE